MALALGMSILANQKEEPTKLDQEAFEKAQKEFTQKLQENAIMVGFCVNILLDRLENLSDVGVVWAKELKRFGNLFKEKLVANEKMIWQHIADPQNQDYFFQVSAHMDKVFAKIVNFNNEEFLTLFQAVDMIANKEILEVADEQQLDNLRDSKELLAKITTYVQSKPRITQAETLQYLRSL